MSVGVSVVVVNLNRRELVGRCLESLWKQTFKDFEVVVVDNGSIDGSMEFLNSLRDARLQIVSLPVNRGFAGGCNAGILCARGRFIATLNNDAEADPRWLERPHMDLDAIILPHGPHHLTRVVLSPDHRGIRIGP